MPDIVIDGATDSGHATDIDHEGRIARLEASIERHDAELAERAMREHEHPQYVTHEALIGFAPAEHTHPEIIEHAADVAEETAEEVLEEAEEESEPAEETITEFEPAPAREEPGETPGSSERNAGSFW